MWQPELIVFCRCRRLAEIVCIGLLLGLVSGLIGACSSGGSGSTPIPPTLPWGRFRHDITNSGLGIGDLSHNPGVLRFSVALPGGTTLSSPAIGIDDTIYIGSVNGLVAMDPNGENLRVFEGYTTDDCSLCTPATDGCRSVGPINSSPAVTADGTIVAQTDDGRIIAVYDDGEELTCGWVFESQQAPPGRSARSSPVVRTDYTEGFLTAVYVGTVDGHLLALNGDGTEKWRISLGPTPGQAIDASPAISSYGILYLTTADGSLHAIGLQGRKQWSFASYSPWRGEGLLPSPAVEITSYFVSADGLLTATNPDGTLKWRQQLGTEIRGSPAFVSQYVGLAPTPTPTPTLESTPIGTQEPTPTETATTAWEQDVVVYVVDEAGTVYGIRDSTGALEGSIALHIGGVSTSPVINLQSMESVAYYPFVVVGGDDGFVYVSSLDGVRPCSDCEDSQWEDLTGGGGRVSVGDTVRSSPVIGYDGTIYVTTANGFLHAIGPTSSETSPTETPSPSPTPTPTGRNTALPV